MGRVHWCQVQLHHRQRGVRGDGEVGACLLREHMKGKSQWRRMPMPESRTCSRYHASAMNTGHCRTKVIHTTIMPLPSELRSENAMPTSFWYEALNEYCPSSHSPLDVNWGEHRRCRLNRRVTLSR